MTPGRAVLAVAAWVVCAAVAAGGSRSPSSLVGECDALCRKEAFRSAQRCLDEALALARAGGDLAAECDAMAALARVEDGLGRFTAAAETREAALALARRAGDVTREFRILSDAGAGHWQRAEYDAAERALMPALDGQRAHGDRTGEATTLVRLGRVAFKQGRYDEAMRRYGQALALAEAAHDGVAAAAVHVDIGLVRLDQRAYARAIEHFERSLALAENAGDVERQVIALDHIGITFLFQNAPGEARTLFERALARARAAGDLPLEMKVQHLLANALRQAGDHHLAIEAYGRCAAFCAAEGNDREAAWNDARRSRAEAALGRLADAEHSLARAIATWDRIRERRPLAFELYSLGKLQVAQGRDEEARVTFARALAAQREIGLPYDSLLLSDMAVLEARLGNAPRAAVLAREAVARADAVHNPEMQWTSLFGLARVERLAGRRADARRSLQRSLAVIEAMRDEVSPSDEAKAGFFADKQDVFAEAVDLSFETGRVEDGLEIGERARARAFLDLLAAAREPDPRLTFRGRIVPLVPSEAAVPPATLVEIRAEARRRNAVVLAYFTAEPRSFVFVVEPQGRVRGAAIPLGFRDLRRRVSAVRRALENGAESAPELLRGLHDVLVAPVADALPPDPERLVIVIPHGPLSLLPFACLRTPAGSYLVEHHTLSYAPALAVLRHGTERGAREGPIHLLAVGDPLGSPAAADGGHLPPLPAAAREAREIAGLMPPGSGVVLVGADASEARLRAYAPGQTALHIATHAFVSDAAPLESYLALAPGPPERRAEDDGRLTAREVMRLALHADMVTLSGCDTGLAEQGEGISGFTRAFLHAGARSIVVSLWRVADVIGREQMTRLYRGMQRDRLDEAHALRRAQLETIEMLRRGTLHDDRDAPLRESPLLWAPFVLIGEPSISTPVRLTAFQPAN